jgi:catechol 2,3-dioxygenase
MQIKELGHLVLYVRDINVSAHFYRDVLGWQPILDHGEESPFPAMAFNSSSERTHHELLLIEVGPQAAPIPPGRRVGLYHFGLKVGNSDDELREALERLRGNQVKIVGATDHGMTHSLYIEDPDGNEIELYIDVPGVREPLEAGAAVTGSSRRRTAAPAAIPSAIPVGGATAGAATGESQRHRASDNRAREDFPRGSPMQTLIHRGGLHRATPL